MSNLKIAVAIVLLFGSIQRAFAWEDATHASITNAAVQSVATSDYPDLHRFADAIIGNSHGVKAEVNAHGSLLKWYDYGDGDASLGGPIQTHMRSQYGQSQYTVSGGLSIITPYSTGGAYDYMG